MGSSNGRAAKQASAAPRSPTVAAPRAGQPHGRLLELQRDAGNKAVAAGLGVARDIVSDINHITTVLYEFGFLPVDLWFDVAMSLHNAWDVLDIAKTNFEIAAINADTARLAQEVAEMRAAVDRESDHTQGHPGSRGHEKAIVLAFIASGKTDDIDMTDEIFFMRHPERSGQKLDPAKPADSAYITEWVKIRTAVVRPTLGSQLGKLLRAGVPKGSGESTAKAAQPEAAAP
jgi:hypothetical protein